MKTLRNIILAVIAIAAFCFAVVAKGLTFFIGFFVCCWAIIRLVSNNTDWLEYDHE